jgi:2-methylcitrate dehydratase PrpD
MTGPSGITAAMAAHVGGLGYDDLPPQVVQKAKDVVLDSLGGQIACSQLPHGRMAIEYARSQTGAPHATVVGTGFKTGIEHAALVNGILAHGDEIDEPRHRAAVLLPAVLAAAEREHTDGKTLIVSLVAGYDVATRLARAGLDLDGLAPRNFQEGSVPGSVASAAAVARLIGLDQMGIQAAMGIGAEQACGLQAMRLETGHMNKSLHMGVGARNGLTAAYLAAQGYGSGVTTVLEPPYSIFEAFIPDGWKAEELTLGLGQRFDILDTGFKKYSAGRPIHSAIALLIGIVEGEGLGPDDIERIEVHLPTLEHGLLSRSRTLNINIEYVIAVAAIDRQVTWDQYSEERRADPVVRKLWERVISVADARLDEIKKSGIGARPAGIEIQTTSGKVITKTMLFPPGHPENPMTAAELAEKFDSWATRVISPQQATRLRELIGALDELDDVSLLGDSLRVA